MANKLRTYKIKIRYIFNGTVDVLAGSKKESKMIVKLGFGGIHGEVGNPSWLSTDKFDEGITNWDIPTMPDRVDIY